MFIFKHGLLIVFCTMLALSSAAAGDLYHNAGFRFKGPMTGVWITKGTHCTNHLFPMDGGIAVLENARYKGQPAWLFWQDDIDGGRRMGVESDTCHFLKMKRKGKNRYTGRYVCGGEGIMDATGKWEKSGRVTLQSGSRNGQAWLKVTMDGKTRRFLDCPQ